MNPDVLNDLIAKTAPMIFSDQIRALYRYASRAQSGVIVEIGTYKGASAITMALAVKDAGNDATVYTIDPFMDWTARDGLGHSFTYLSGNQRVFEKNVDHFGVDKIVKPIKKHSADAAKSWKKKDAISLLFIDGDHTRAYEDFQAFRDYLTQDAVVVFHDSEYESVDYAIQDATNNGMEVFEMVSNMTVLRHHSPF